jgi:ribosome-binding factor A
MALERRGKRVGSLIKEEISRFIIEDVQDPSQGLITVTRVDVAADLKTARIYLSVFGSADKQALLSLLEKRSGFIRNFLATRIKLKYNPQLIFLLDPAPDYEEKLDRLIEEMAKKDESNSD